MREDLFKTLVLIGSFFMVSCGSDNQHGASQPYEAGIKGAFSNVSQMKVNHFGRQFHFMTAKGPKIGGKSCLYKKSERLNLCAAVSPDNDKTFKQLAANAENQILPAPKLNTARNSFEVATYDFGVASLACLQPIDGPNSKRLYVVGGQIPLNHSQTCFANFVCSEKNVLEVNAGIRMCGAGLTTELAVTYDSKESKLGLYVKGSADADDVNFKVLFDGSKLAIESVGRDFQAPDTVLNVETIQVDVEELRPMVEMLSDQMKRLGDACFNWMDEG